MFQNAFHLGFVIEQISLTIKMERSYQIDYETSQQV